MNLEAGVLQRLERMEGKLDSLTDAVVRLARLEERLGGYMSGHRRLDEHVQSLTNRLRDIEQVHEKAKGAFSMGERFAWAIVTLSSGLIGYLLQKLLLGTDT